ncbi:PHB depolymerase family esterase [uncultured Litoreibacter sp.]|uniref:alpha/beta hydrolase family esterase n=1 Tax=uncultured Litoreibacter sp. TaxID=1392394 RepID=UPI00260F803C|nr:PHB depolymerase family esterase [uncultured Litoreibacter sp.]
MIRFFFVFMSWAILNTSAHASSVKYPQAFVHDGRERLYYLNVPDDLPENAPLIVALHGMGGQSHKMRYGLGLHELASELGFATLFPQGSMFGEDTSHWNTGEGPGEQNDTDFLLALIEHVVQTHGLDPSRVYVMGISNGAQMAYHLGCHAPYKIAGVVAIIGTISGTDWSECYLNNPVSLLHIHGKADPVVPFDGGHSWYNAEFSYPSVPELISHWVQEVGAAPTPVAQTLQNAEITRYETELGAVVELVAIDNFGHDWPHLQNAGFSASRLIADFVINLPHR